MHKDAKKYAILYADAMYFSISGEKYKIFLTIHKSADTIK
jgi:hypothetical protein